jgi:hypothetical protein
MTDLSRKKRTVLRVVLPLMRSPVAAKAILAAGHLSPRCTARCLPEGASR